MSKTYPFSCLYYPKCFLVFVSAENDKKYEAKIKFIENIFQNAIEV